jgi:cytochrome P450
MHPQHDSHQQDFLDPSVLANPYPIYAKLREESVNGDWSRRAWLRLYRYADVEPVLRNSRCSTASIARLIDRKVALRTDESGLEATRQIRQTVGRLLLYTDPPDHTRIRRVLHAWFNHHMIALLEFRVAEIVRELLAPARLIGRFDLVSEMAFPLPVKVISEMLGFPPDDFVQIKAITGGFIQPVGTGDLNYSHLESSRQSLAALEEYLDPLIEERRRMPRFDLLSVLVEAMKTSQIDRAEITGTCMTPLIGGQETTSGLIASGMLALLRHPDQLALLRSDLSLLPLAIEELLRYDSPSQLAARVATEDFQLNGFAVRRRTVLECWIGAANRDPDRFGNPDDLNIRRNEGPNLAFGLGRHHCLGAALARLEAGEVFRQLLATMPPFRLETNDIAWQPSVIFRCPVSVPVVFDA